MRFFPRRKGASTKPSEPSNLTKPQLKRATRTRKSFSLLTSFFLFLTFLFLILVEIGGTHNRSVIRDWYFIKIDVSNIVPASVPNAALINTIAQTLGLHDFYQVGLWGFCEGYLAEGVTFCSTPKTLYWFNPVEIMKNELLAGASINLPSNINDILKLIRIASHVMFGFFLTSTILSFLLIFLMPVSVLSRWATLPIAVLTFLNALFVTVASVIGTAMFIIFRNVIAGVSELNIDANVGTTLFAFMWTASAFGIFACLVQTGLCCCCASRRDVKTGRKRGSKHAYSAAGVEAAETADGAAGTGGDAPVQEKSARRGWGLRGRRNGS